jgi:ParB family chromosome partitioning protein
MAEDKKRGGLGRGIGSLIPGGQRDAVDVFFSSDSAGMVAVPGAKLAYLELSRIKPNAQQPRKVFEEGALSELIHSIKEFGVLQPIVVRPKGDDFELIMGERRLRASKEAGLTAIPAVIRDTTDDNMLRDALLENLHRADLNPIEEASAYKQLLEDFGITQDQLADRLGRSRPQITNTMRLLRLPLDVQSKLVGGALTAGHARALLAAADDETMRELASRVIREGLSVRGLEELIASGGVKTKKPKIKAGTKTEMLSELADQLSDYLNTRVKIAIGRKKGQITIEFGSVADLRRIADEIQKK